MSDLMNCGCCTCMQQYIESHLDPDGILTGHEDASEILAQFTAMDDPDSDYEPVIITLDDVREYLTARQHQ